MAVEMPAEMFHPFSELKELTALAGSNNSPL
jgi:hypothetical protein